MRKVQKKTIMAWRLAVQSLQLWLQTLTFPCSWEPVHKVINWKHLKATAHLQVAVAAVAQIVIQAAAQAEPLPAAVVVAAQHVVVQIVMTIKKQKLILIWSMHVESLRRPRKKIK